MATIRGLMPDSLELGESRASCRVRFLGDEPFFLGHFPSYPIVPGMIMLEGLVGLAQRWRKTEAPLTRVVEAKFRSEVRPEDEIDLHVAAADGGQQQVVAKILHAGRVVLDARFILG